ncbi:sulfurtransferase complex subunit TusD [Aliiglaciecola sp. CAU 1673]|uniref:sulfurtransferase complex subunit TusD n=1 Tax=Aliiglaciecola sp. CAU 1673 TaxID=3032595 RepID=UPI0023DA6A08|nr:sulfurtransferase complex subunit TusD [Aliiglaciecola sp. CAU 1673]MDF2177607.1 sulfurtransferase complex subunit TusD [Aliiglaciecola sp. CAU 1673]
MANFTLVVTSPPFDNQGSESALSFADALLAKGHMLNGVFFYQAGVHHANGWQTPPNDEMNPFKRWSALASQYRFPLHVCITAANRRGLLEEDNEVVEGHNLLSPFLASGLGQLVELCEDCDRVVQF